MHFDETKALKTLFQEKKRHCEKKHKKTLYQDCSYFIYVKYNAPTLLSISDPFVIISVGGILVIPMECTMI